ncbi:uncharacterized protein LOC126416045 isoform X2 [Schistocerca serialis cubense]|uniref:uncharacterized protein LOC126416045 isoform X2 n=1 Tax=Schistocerca serialis cubense TaxID=2023355 RepID=UPI00214EF579|nr:uncharacterized protein LOC126416045 isoform X2 [Schistocerca serialis cubense]
MSELVCVDVSSRLITEKEFLLQFISLYREFPELWKIGSEGYRDKKKRALAINKIAEVLRLSQPYITREDVKRKINIVRTTYNRESNKIRKSKQSASSPGEIYVPKLWYFNELSFLDNQLEEEAAIGAIENQVIDEGETDHSNADVVNELCTPSVSFVTSVAKPEPRMKKIKLDPIARQKDPLHITHSFSERSSSKSEQEIPTIVKVWCEKLLTLDPQQRIFAEKAINDVLFEASLGTLHRHSVTINSSPLLSSPSASSPRKTFCASCSASLAVGTRESSQEAKDTEKDSTS